MLKKRWLRWLAAVAGVMLLVGAAGFWWPRQWLQKETWRHDLQAVLSRQTGWDISFGNVAFEPLPRPHLSVAGVRVTIPGTAAINARSVRFYPRFLPWLWGDLRFSKVEVVEPVIRAVLTPETPASQGVSSRWFEQNLDQQIVPALNRFSHFFVNGTLELENGSFQLKSGQRRQMVLSHAQANLFFTPPDIGFKFSARDELRVQSLSLAGRLTYAEGQIKFHDLGGALGRSFFSGLDGSLDWKATPKFQVDSGRVVLGVNTLVPLLAGLERESGWLGHLTSTALSLRLTSALVTGPWLDPAAWSLEATGEVDNLLFSSGEIPGMAQIQAGAFSLHDRVFALQGVRVKLPDSWLTVSGELRFPSPELINGTLVFNGVLGQVALNKLAEDFSLPAKYPLRGPINIVQANIDWNQKPEIALNAGLEFPNEVFLAAQGTWSKRKLDIQSLTLHTPVDRAEISLRLDAVALDFSLAGSVSPDLANRLGLQPLGSGARLAGQFQIHAERNHPQALWSSGELSGGNIELDLLPGEQVKVGGFRLSSQPRGLGVNLDALVWGNTKFSAQGALESADDNYSARLTVKAADVDVDALINTIDALSSGPSPAGPQAQPPLAWQLDLTVAAQHAIFSNYPFTQIQSLVRVKPDASVVQHTVDLTFEQANLDGISATGSVRVQKGVIILDVVPSASHQDLQLLLNAVSRHPPRFTGAFDLSGRITGQGTSERILDGLQGNLAFHAVKGRIFNFTLLSQILTLINVSEILVGTLPGFGKEGVGYSDFNLNGSLDNGKFNLAEGLLKADNMTLSGKGTVELEHGFLDLVVLVAPFKTMDRVIGAVPLVNYLFNNHLVAFPVAAKGTLGEPKLNYLSVSVDEGLFGILKRTLLLPVYLASPLLPKSQAKPAGPAPAPAGVSPTVQNR